MRSLLAALLVAACANPSPLDRKAVNEVDALAPWAAIADRARPLDAGAEHLDDLLATRDPAKQTAALEAWARAGGRWLHTPTVRPTAANGPDDAALAVAMAATELVSAHPDDDALVEATLYLAQRLRRDGSDMLTSVTAVVLTRTVIHARTRAPAFASHYAPSDAEVIRAFEAEAMFVSRQLAFGHDGERRGSILTDPDLTRWAWLADVPGDRAGFLAALRAHDDHHLMTPYADKLFGAVDDYAAWLTRTGP